MRPPHAPKRCFQNGKKRPVLCPQFFYWRPLLALLSYPLPAVARRNHPLTCATYIQRSILRRVREPRNARVVRPGEYQAAQRGQIGDAFKYLARNYAKCIIQCLAKSVGDYARWRTCRKRLLLFIIADFAELAVNVLSSSLC
jgi:hypothetical protein